MPFLDESKQASFQDKDSDKKTIDWWTARMWFSRYMYQDAAETHWNATKAHTAQYEYFKAMANYRQNWGEDFNPMQRPLEVAEKCPDNVDQRIEI